ncbi:MAG: hypothetical protein J0L78_06745 [Planctomycetes bacterium]|nr:hypothetical protein [Planctomycetota bacterium]
MRYWLPLAFAAVAHAANPTASITYLRSNDNPPLVMVTAMAMSGDGKTVVGQYMIWTAATGLRPTEFSPDQGGYLNYHALNYDGSVRFGEVASFGGANFRFWSGPWGLGRVDWQHPFSPSTDVTLARRALSGDGQRLVGQMGTPVLMERLGVMQGLFSSGVGRVAAINFDGSIVAGATYATGGPFGTVWLLTPVSGGFVAETKNFPKAEFDSVSSDGAYAAGFFDWGGGSSAYRGIVWHIDAEADFFLSPLGTSGVSYINFLSNGGEIAAGVAPRPGWPMAFVRRRGERARDLRQVLQRFGATGLDYYMLTNIAGLSDDGKTVCGYAQSPWFGNVAFVATIPEWPACPSDINFDGAVDDADFLIDLTQFPLTHFDQPRRLASNCSGLT